MNMLKLTPEGTIERYPYPLGDLLADHPHTSFALPLDPADLADFGVYPVAEVAAPSTTIEQLLAEGAPAMIDGVWTQQWSVTSAPPELVAERRRAIVPVVIDMAQARLQLLAAGLLDQIDLAIDTMPEPQRSAARIEWEYRTQVRRASALVASLGAALGLDAEQIDALFISAASR